MAARNGLIGEFLNQSKQAELSKAQATREIDKKYRAAVELTEQLRREEEKITAELERATEKERKQIEREAKAAHTQSMVAKANELNLQLALYYHDIDTLLNATLDVDDYVDLNELKRTAVHPPFSSSYEIPLPAPLQEAEIPMPTFIPPTPEKGLRGLLGKAKYERALQAANHRHQVALENWRQQVEANAQRYESRIHEHSLRDKERVTLLEDARNQYHAECSARETEITEFNGEIDQLINNLGYGTVDAIHEYVKIVLSNSVYPPHFPVGYSFVFDADNAELDLTVIVPGPSEIGTIKSYKYTKSTDEISTTELSQKACRDRYTNAVHQVAIRSLHEIFEADRRGLIKTISLKVGTETINPATGNQEFVLFVATGAERNSFLQFELTCVVPSATLEHLGASISKNPFNLTPADSKGVRRS